ncbi:MAG TPA: Ni/Fe hydrogenase subunit alpha [Burkholderiales bacterium]|nr:Ni/Fe hydrogenase subunit alpha [Burkholderiales bacterium]
MSANLESTPNPQALRRVAIEPITRVEGHGKITLLLDEANRVRQARFHIVEFRGFEKFVQGRPYWEVPVMVQRLCGICPVSHHLAGGKAVDMLAGAVKLTPTAEKMRRLLHLGQVLQSHALHFFHLASPDLLFGFGAEIAKRNVLAVAAAFPEVAKKGVLLRKYGQEVIRVIAGKRVHGSLVVPGGVNKHLSREERDYLLKDLAQTLAWCREAVDIARKLYVDGAAAARDFAALRSPILSLVRADGALELYDGVLRARDESGAILFDRQDPAAYEDVLHEAVKPWSYMKFPFLRALGGERGWYRVGPLARVFNCDFIPTPLAEEARRELVAHDGGSARHASLAYHWARMIEMLHTAEGIGALLDDADLLGGELVAAGARQWRGVGVIEAPRGTLIHDYRIDEDDLIVRCNLIVSTTHNNQAMNEAVRSVAREHLDGRELTEGLLNHLEVAIRAYDPCLSCATHALGRMPLEVELVDAAGARVSALARDGDGSVRAA